MKIRKLYPWLIFTLAGAALFVIAARPLQEPQPAGDITTTNVVTDAVNGGGSLLLLVIGMTQFIKQLGVKGIAIRLIAFGLGFAGAVAYSAGIHGAPISFLGWFNLVCLGLTFGLGVPGVYDAGADLAGKAAPVTVS